MNFMECKWIAPYVGAEGGVEGELEPLDLVGQVHLGVEGVVGVPLLGEGQAVLGHLVLGLQGATNLKRGRGRREENTVNGLSAVMIIVLLIE